MQSIVSRSILLDITRTIIFASICFVWTATVLRAQSLESSAFRYQGTIASIQVEGLQLIEKGLIYATISSQQGQKLSPQTISEDIKSLYRLGHFNDIQTEIEPVTERQFKLIFKLVEKPKITLIEIQGNELLSDGKIKGVIKVFLNNMVNLKRIKADVKAIADEYKKSGYMQTMVDYEIVDIDNSSVKLVYKIKESPKVFLTDINITGTKVYPPLDIERIIASAEIDCFSWANESGVFHAQKVNQDMQLITQHYLVNGYIKVKIDKPKVVLIRNPDYSRVVVDINITEGDQYFVGDVDIVSADGHPLLFDKTEMLETLALQTDEIYNPFKQNGDRFKISDSYLEQGYAFQRVRVTNDIDDKTKKVNVTFHVTKGEKAYIGRVEIQGNYETIDKVVRREMEIHDNELYNGVKLRASQRNISRLGFFKTGTGVKMEKSEGEEASTLDYDVVLEEGQTGTFNASVTYSGETGFALILSIAKKNFLGTGRTISFSTEAKDQGDSRFDFGITTPYFLDTKFTNRFSVYSVFENGTYYDTQSNGFSVGMSYPIWKDWSLSSTYSYREENYQDISDTGETLLDNAIKNSFRTLGAGVTRSTVDHPMFPSDGSEISMYMSQVGGPLLGGNTEYRTRSFNYKYFKRLNEQGTIVFGLKFNWSYLEQSNPDKEIPNGKRYTLGGVTTVRGFDWNEIKGPSSEHELPDGFDIEEKYPYQADYMADNGLTDQADCNVDPLCASLPVDKHETREYYETHTGGNEKRLLNLQIYFPLTREGQNIKGLIFYDAGNVWAEDRMYEITGLERNDWYYRQSIGTGVNLITPMGVLRFEYGFKLNKLEGESPGRFDFHISGLF